MTTNTKHTPGPWVFNTYVLAKGQGSVPTKIQCGGKAYGRDIASLNFDIEDPELSSDKVLANAKLIAAAPEMLEALDALLTEVSPAFNFDLKNAKNEAVQKALAAIKKATE